ncbi:MAG: hypothetical protein PHC51_01940 [bacterium]|nr:hypothetical protein [bacterium]
MYNIFGDLLFISANVYWLWTSFEGYLELDQNNLPMPTNQEKVRPRSRMHLKQASLYYISGILLPLCLLVSVPLLLHGLQSESKLSLFHTLIIGVASGTLIGLAGWTTIWSMVSGYFAYRLRTKEFNAQLARHNNIKDEYDAFCGLANGILCRSSLAAVAATVLLAATRNTHLTIAGIILFVILFAVSILPGVKAGLIITRQAHFRFINN